MNNFGLKIFAISVSLVASFGFFCIVESSKIIKDLKEKNKRINKQKNDLILKNKKQKEVIKDYRLL